MAEWSTIIGNPLLHNNCALSIIYVQKQSISIEIA
jgi:hypothetical protein